ncbi:Crp/Fnr family transcriptional regulator [Microvirga sp. BT689]|uniref:Crp/Fnr family transcriptional regulator n=1 Tax=Microvirga arvi TaxID=2778731 RepID=UPI00194F5610|nr:Crp/Fnr family transcriptional regulator [Microvirga arvi]MBM6583059.1 Crp/Fnr family transcriptional regulator [Microvirga arvi]
MPTPFIRKLEYGAGLSDQDRQVLEQAVHDVRQFKPRHDLILEDDSPENIHVILEGFACRYKRLPDGTRQIMAYLIPGDCCDLHVPILSRIDHTIGTLTPCKVAFLPHIVIEDLMSQSRSITRALWWATLVDAGTVREWLINMSRRPADKRLAHLLCELLMRLQAVGLATENSFVLPLTQRQLADTLAMTGVHLNRIVRQLRLDGLIMLKVK